MGRMKATEYHRHIVDFAEVPMVDESRHDLLNALVWLTFPRIKTALMKRHCMAVKSRNPSEPNRRTREEDALSHFDESGLIVVSCDLSMLRAIQDLSWKELFWERRTQFLETTRVFVFGHGLAEKLLHPFVVSPGTPSCCTCRFDQSTA